MTYRNPRPRVMLLAILPLLLACAIGCQRMRQAALRMDARVHAFFRKAPLEDHMRRNASIIMGTVTLQDDETPPVCVVALSAAKPSGRYVDRVILIGSGPYMLYLPPGSYYIFALIDDNRDYVFDESEYAGYHGTPSPLTIRERQVVSGIDLSLTAARYEGKGFEVNVIAEHGDYAMTYGRRSGTVARMEDHLFDEAWSKAGYFNPEKFIEKIGAAIYFLEPYDANKTPVLFIHGCSGSPRDFAPLVAKIDRSRFQPWFYYYPSGIRMESASAILDILVRELSSRYGFPRLCVAAHSMGGLVARSYLCNAGDKGGTPLASLLVTISTPWGGNQKAARGLGRAPFQVPVWSDIATGSPFLDGLYQKKLAPGIRFVLLCSYLERVTPDRELSDGTITLESQLDKRIAGEATATYGFQNDHTGILSDASLAERLNAILTDEVDRRSAPATRP